MCYGVLVRAWMCCPGFLYLWTNNAPMFHLLSNIRDIWAKVPSITPKFPGLGRRDKSLIIG